MKNCKLKLIDKLSDEMEIDTSYSTVIFEIAGYFFDCEYEDAIKLKDLLDEHLSVPKAVHDKPLDKYFKTIKDAK